MGRAACLLSVLFFVGCIGPIPKSRPDALDKISGTEGWKDSRLDLETEWRQWQDARSSWRSALREARLQRARNRRVVLLVKRAKILDNSVDDLRFDSKPRGSRKSRSKKGRKR